MYICFDRVEKRRKITHNFVNAKEILHIFSFSTSKQPLEALKQTSVTRILS